MPLRLGLRPAVAMLSSSNFGSRPDVESARPVRQGLTLVHFSAQRKRFLWRRVYI